MSFWQTTLALIFGSAGATKIATDAKPAEPKPSARLADPAFAQSLDELIAALDPRRDHNPFDPPKQQSLPPSVTAARTKFAMDEGFGGGDFGEFAVVSRWAFGALGGMPGAERESFIGYPQLAVLATIPEYRAAPEIIAQESTRKWIKLKAKGDKDKTKQIEAIEAEMVRLDVRDTFRRLSEQDAYFGRAHLYLDTGDTEKLDELKTDIGDGRNKASQNKLDKGCLEAIRTIEAQWCSPLDYETVNPLSRHWYRPRVWLVASTPTHASRLLTFIARPVPDLLKPAYMFGGLSMSQIMRPVVQNWLRTRSSVGDIVNAFSQMVLSTNMTEVLNTGGSGVVPGGSPAQVFKRAELFNMLRSNRGLFMIDKTAEDFKNVAAPLGTLDALQGQSQEHMASLSRIPIIKLLGIQPAGLNASSEGELTAFEDNIRSYQEAFFRPNLTTVIDIIMISLFGEVDEDIHFDFEPMTEMDETEIANLHKIEADTASVHLANRTITHEEERKRVASDPDTLYPGLEDDGEEVAELSPSEAAQVNQVVGVAITGLFEAALIDKPTALKELQTLAKLTGIGKTIDAKMIKEAEEEPPPPAPGTMGPPGAPGAPPAPGGAPGGAAPPKAPAAPTGKAIGVKKPTQQQLAGDDDPTDEEWEQLIKLITGDQQEIHVNAKGEQIAHYLTGSPDDDDSVVKIVDPNGTVGYFVKPPDQLDFPKLRGISADAWEEGKHPRGQPENAGQFGPGGGGGAAPEVKKKAPADPASKGWGGIYSGVQKLSPEKKSDAWAHFKTLVDAPSTANVTLAEKHFKALPPDHKQTVIAAFKQHLQTATTAAAPSKSVSAPAPKAEPSSAPSGSLKKVSGKLGSNEGGVFEDGNGAKFYVKIPKTADHVDNEILANSLYKKLGVPVFDLHKTEIDGKPAVASKMESLTPFNPNDKDQVAQVHANFVSHAFLANWDAVGLAHDNQALTPQGMTTIDSGGSINYRAQGGPKPFGPKVNEWDTMRDPSKGPGAKVMSTITPIDLAKSAKPVLSLSNDDIDAAVKGAGYSGQAALDLAMTLKMRREDIAQRVKNIAKESVKAEQAKVAQLKAQAEAQAEAKAAGQQTAEAKTNLKAIAAVRPAPTHVEQVAIQSYKGSGYSHMNEVMRFQEEHTPQTKQIKNWLERSALPEDVTLFRGVKPSEGTKTMFSMLHVGGSFTDQGFGSTSTLKSFSDSWRGGSTSSGVLFTIHAKKGQKAASVRGLGESDGEHEVLLAAQSRFKVIAIDKATRHVTVELNQDHF